MAGQNPYEPSLAPVNQTADTRVESETQVTEDQQQLDYTTVMRAGNDGSQNRDVQAVADRTNLSDVQDPDIIKAVTLTDNAKTAAMLLSVQESNRPDNTPVEMLDGSGRPFTITMGQLKQKLIEELSKNSDFKGFNDPAQVREFISKSTESALTLSQQTREKYEARSRDTDTNVNARNELAKQLGFVPTTREIPDGNGGKKTLTSYDITQKDIDAKLATTTDAAQKANLEKLKGLLTNYDSIQKERNALSAVDMAAAQLMMGGFTHKAGEQTLEGLPATRHEVMRAYETMNKAGRGNPQLEQTPQYQMAKEQSSAMYADIQLQRSKDAVLALQEADKLRVAGKPTDAQAKYEEALQKVKGVDMATITTQWQSQMKEYNTVQEKLTALGNPPSNPNEAQRLTLELQQRQQIGLQLEQIIQVGKEVKTEYAKFLNEQGKPGEALPLLTSVASSTPAELLAGDATFNEQMEKAQSLGSITSGDAEKHRVLYEQAMTAKDWTTAERELAALKAASTKASEQSIQSVKDRLGVMDKRQTEIQTELADLQKNNSMDAEAKALRQQQLEAEKNGYDVLRKSLSDSLGPAEKAAQEHAHALRYMEGIIAYSKDDKETANKIFKELEAEAPEIAANKDYQLEALLEDTRKKGWLERNLDTIVSVVKVVAVVGAVIAATVLTAPIGGVGGIAAAAALGATFGAVGVATVGAAGHGVAKLGGYKSTNSYNNWSVTEDLKSGAIQGGIGGALSGLFAVGGVAKLGTGMVQSGEAIAANAGATTFRSAALNYGGNALIKGQALAAQATSLKGSLAIGTTYGYGGEAYNSITTGKEFSFQDATLRAAGTTAALYGAGRTGGLGSFKGSAVYGAGMTVQEQGIAYKNGKDLGQIASDSFGSFTGHMTTAFAVGTFANMNRAAAAYSEAGRFASVLPAGEKLALDKTGQILRNLPGAMRSQTSTSASLLFKEGLGITGSAKYWVPAAGAGLVGWQQYQSENAYEDSRTAKPWDHPDGQTRMRMNQTIEALGRPVKRPVIKQPGQP